MLILMTSVAESFVLVYRHQGASRRTQHSTCSFGCLNLLYVWQSCSTVETCFSELSVWYRHRGVSRRIQDSSEEYPWQAFVQHKKVKHYLGCWGTEADAGRAYDQALICCRVWTCWTQRAALALLLLTTWICMVAIRNMDETDQVLTEVEAAFANDQALF